MADTKTELLETLRELEETIRVLPSRQPRPSLLPLFARIDELAGQLPRETDPALMHYLQKKSYEKARLYLEGREEENQAGHCRHV